MAYITADAINMEPEGIRPPRLSDTYWGYRIEEDRDDGEFGLSEPVIRFVGLVLILSAYAQWLLPASVFSGDVFLMKASLSALLGSAGVGLYWFGARGRARVVEVDLSRRQVRVARRTGRGELRVLGTHPIAAIDSACLKRPGTPGSPAELHLRLRNTRRTFCVAEGEEADLLAIHRRLSADFRPARAKVEDRLNEEIAFHSTRTA